MPLYTPYLIFVLLSFLSFVSFFIVRKIWENEKKTGQYEKPIRNVIIIILGYYFVKIFFGWHLNWFVESIIILAICLYFDYLIILKKNYSNRVKEIYYAFRLLLFGVPIASLVVIFFISGLTLTFGFAFGCNVFPIDSTYGEQQVYKNLYIYRNDCSGHFTFKKKCFFFEKDVAEIGSHYGITFGENRREEDPVTGYVSRQKDTIFITGKKTMPDSHRHIRITILTPEKVQIESVSPKSYPISEGETLQLESHNKQIISL